MTAGCCGSITGFVQTRRGSHAAGQLITDDRVAERLAIPVGTVVNCLCFQASGRLHRKGELYVHLDAAGHCQDAWAMDEQIPLIELGKGDTIVWNGRPHLVQSVRVYQEIP